jgi:hypothetical protein
MTGATPESRKSLAPRICAQEFLRSQLLLLANRLISSFLREKSSEAAVRPACSVRTQGIVLQHRDSGNLKAGDTPNHGRCLVRIGETPRAVTSTATIWDGYPSIKRFRFFKRRRHRSQ